MRTGLRGRDRPLCTAQRERADWKLVETTSYLKEIVRELRPMQRRYRQPETEAMS